MRVRSSFLLLFLVNGLVAGLYANEAVDRAHKSEDAGDSAAAEQI